MILFMFEYTILACMAGASFVKYALTVADNATSEPLPNKGLYLIYLDLVIDGITFVLYVAFFGMIMHHYKTIPLHLIRDIYMAYLSLVRRASNFVRYRTVSSKLHQLQDVTEEDLERVGRSCIICREDMALAEGLKKLNCGHVFHLACLRSWLERQQTCPICRHAILPTQGTADAAAADPAAPAAAPDAQPDAAAPVQQPAAAAGGGAAPAAEPAQAPEAGEQPRGTPQPQPPAAAAAGARAPGTGTGSAAAGAQAPASGRPDASSGASVPRRHAQSSTASHGVYGAWGNPATRPRGSVRSQSPLMPKSHCSLNPFFCSPEVDFGYTGTCLKEYMMLFG